MTRRVRTTVMAAVVVLAVATGCTAEAPQAGTSVPSLTDQTYPGTIHGASSESDTAPTSDASGALGTTSPSYESGSSTPDRTEITSTQNTGTSTASPPSSSPEDPTDANSADTSAAATTEVSPGPTPISTKAPGTGATKSSSPGKSVEHTTVKMSAEEVANREEVEEAWLQYWDVFLDLGRMPKADRLDAYRSVAVDPELQTLIDFAKVADKDHLINTGDVRHRIYMIGPTSGVEDVVIADCVDESKLRTKDTSTGEFFKPGSDRVNYNGTLLKQADGSWKVSFLDQRTDQPC